MGETGICRILITGGNGLLAPFLAEAGQGAGDVILTTRRDGRFTADLADAEATATMLKAVRPDVVVHCAAMTDVDACERDPDAADRANRQATENLAGALPAEARLVYVSTDQVYPDVAGPHKEGTEDPVNAYGASKLAGERAALRHPDAVVLRTSFFAASRTPGRRSLTDFVIKSLQEKQPVTLFSDVLFSPLHARTLATLVFEIAAQKLTGVFNAASRDGMSKADFALRIAAKYRLGTETATIGRSTSLPGRAVRPADLRMSTERLEEALGRRMPSLQQEIEKL